MGMQIVSNYQIINLMKGSKYYRVSLGLVPTVENNGSRTYNQNDKFAWFYNSRYATTIYGQGNIGDIRFYTDHYIRENVLAVYYGDNFEEFIFDFNQSEVAAKGVDNYLGYILRETEERYEELQRKNELSKIEEKPKGDASKVLNNPGSVSYDDLKAYLDQQIKNRQL